ncbi:MAG: UvrD-helicase domain-containing protein [Solirubrobacterales bacterium]
MSDVPAPTAEQRAAIQARGTDAFCEAGAGTGKTRVLVDRYCDAADVDEVGIEAILAFTFTERAAAELRARIRHELGRRSRAARERGDDALGERLARASRDTERAWVMTIHGFCRRLLATHPAAAGIDPRFRVLDESEASRLRKRARDEAIDEVGAIGDEAVRVIAAYRDWRIGEMIEVAYERLRSQGMSEPRLPPSSDPVRSRKNADDEPELSPVEREWVLAGWRTLDALLGAFGRRYEALKTGRSGLDFGDLELRALELLRESPAVSAAWRGRFEHVMVDEFQDTNRVQLDLVEELRGPQTRVFRVGDELQSIYRFRNADLAVFRGERGRAVADPDTATLPLTGNFRARPEIVAAVNALGAALLGDTFSPLAAARSPVGAPRVELLLTLDEGKSNGWQEHADVLELPPSESQAKLVAEARALAERLRELVDAGGAKAREIVVLLRAFTHVDAYEEALDRAGLDPYVVGGRGYWSQQQVEDVLRLCEVIANPLDDEMLLGALACPANSVSPDALWLLRRATVDPDASERHRPPHLWPLIESRFGEGDREPELPAPEFLDEIPAEDADRLRRFCALLAELRAAAPVLALDELIERTMTAFEYDLSLLRNPRGRGRMANVRKLTRLAREFESHEGRDLRGFLVSAQELTARDEREGVAAVQAEDHDGVRIMTVHAAKGLEFPVVAVPDLARGLGEGERPGDVIIGRLERGQDGSPRARVGIRLAFPASESFGAWELYELARENAEEAAEEGARLVHVAATRAKERLILSGVYSPADCEECEPSRNKAPQQRRGSATPRRDSAIRRLLPALAARGWRASEPARSVVVDPPAPSADAEPLRGPAVIEVRVSAPGGERARTLAARREPAPATAAETDGAPPPLWRPEPVVPVGHLSYSALADYERCAYRFYVERMLGMAPPPGALHPEGAASDDSGDGLDPFGGERERRLGFGNAVHAALERCAAQGWRAPGGEELAALLAAQGIEHDGELARAREMVDGWLASDLLAELRDAKPRAEVPFALALGDAIVRGQIDLLVGAGNGGAGRQLDISDARTGAGGQLDLLEQSGAGQSVATVVDFKTDRLGDDGPAALAGRYRAQRELYALAVAAGNGGVPPAAVRAIHVFLEAPDQPVVDSFDAGALAAARRRLEAVVAEIRTGGFTPTDEPSHSVCFGCPAAARLCPHPKWKPSWGP